MVLQQAAQRNDQRPLSYAKVKRLHVFLLVFENRSIFENNIISILGLLH